MTDLAAPCWAAAAPKASRSGPRWVKANECAAILAILDRLCVKGALATIDAIATNPTIAQAITDKGGDYILALKRNHPPPATPLYFAQRGPWQASPTLHGEAATSSADPATTGLTSTETLDKDHGRIETRTTTVSHDVAWLTGDRRHPGERRFPALRSLIKTVAAVERGGKRTQDSRFFITAALITPERAADAILYHWGIESLPWVLDVIFKEDQSRPRRGRGVQNMAPSTGSPSTWLEPERKTLHQNRSKAAGWKPTTSKQSSIQPVNLDSLP